MRKHLTTGFLAAATLALGLSAHAADITGAGATFPYPIYAKWAEAYKAKTGVGMNYQSIGSGGGIAQIKAKTVDFGASDAPLKPEALDAAGLMQFPAIIGGIVPVVNIEGVAPGALKLSGPVIGDIYLGKIKSWGDKAIAELNPGLKLPADPITVVRRSDGSGTTFNFTNYLSKVSTGMEGQGRLGHRRRLAGRRGRQGQRGRGRVRAADQGLDRLRRVRVRQEEQHVLRAGPEQGRRVPEARQRLVPGRRRVRRLEERARLLSDHHRLRRARRRGRSPRPASS